MVYVDSLFRGFDISCEILLVVKWKNILYIKIVQTFISWVVLC